MKKKLRFILKQLISGKTIHAVLSDLVSLNLKLNAIHKQSEELRAILHQMKRETCNPHTLFQINESLKRVKTIDYEISQCDSKDAAMREKYEQMDPLIKPLCELFSEHGYLTFASCSAHVGAFSSRSYAKPFFKKQWYILFMPTEHIHSIREISQTLNEKYGYHLELTRFSKESHEPLLLYRLQFDIQSYKKDYNDYDLYDINRNIYQEFAAHLQANTQKE